MKRKYSYIFIVILSAIILFNCTDDPVTPEDSPPKDSPPKITKISPTGYVITRHVGDVINFKAQGYDADGDDYSFKGRLNQSEVPLVVNGDEASYTFNMDRRGNNIFEMIVQNTESDSVEWIINVDNVKPVASNLILLPNNPAFQDTAKISFDKYDAEGDSLTEIIKWHVNNSLTQTGGKSFILNGLNYSDVVKATVQLYDGFAYSETKTSNSIVLPSEPDPVYTLTHGLYDNFDGMGGEQTYDGSQLAEAGGLSSDLWRPDPRGSTTVGDISEIVGDSVSSGSNPSGNVVKMVNSEGKDRRLELINPEDIDFADYQSFSADVMIPSDAENDNFLVALDYHTSIPEQPPGISWYVQMGLRKKPGVTGLFGQWTNKNTNQTEYFTLGNFDINKWYNLRMDIVKTNESELKIEFYINNEKMIETIPSDSEILLDPSRLGFGPKRSFQIYVPDGDSSDEKKAAMYIDNVKAVFKNRIQ